jgi:hypothetical protein
MAVSSATRQVVRIRAKGLCEYCHADEKWQFVRFTMDHIRPISDGGSDEADNLALACRNCNERRGLHRIALDPLSGTSVPLYNPRQDNWAEHFVWSMDRKVLMGRTATGRATVAFLDMNDDRHEGVILRIRQRDLDDGIHDFPHFR